MNQEELGNLLHIIDHQLIEISDPRRSGYFRGYRLGIQLHQMGMHEDTAKEHFQYYQCYIDSDDPYFTAYLRGFIDGCRGVRPEDLH